MADRKDNVNSLDLFLPYRILIRLTYNLDLYSKSLFKKRFIFNFVCVCVVRIVCMPPPSPEESRGVRAFRAGVSGHSEPPDVGAGN